MKPVLYALATVAVFTAMVSMFLAAVCGHEWLMVALLSTVAVAGMAANDTAREIDATVQAQAELREVEES